MRKKASIAAVSVVLSVLASPAHAVIFDPSPVLKSFSESPPEIFSSSWMERLFFYPLPQAFYKDPDEIPVQTLMLEAVGEGYEGMVAVGEVIRNRTKLFSKDTTAVCLMPKQFSCWNDPGRAREFLKEHREYYWMAYLAWKESETSSLTLGATDYHADYVLPYWAKAYRSVANIGRHIFYDRQKKELTDTADKVEQPLVGQDRLLEIQ